MAHPESLAPITAWTVDGIPADARRSLGRIARSEDVERIAVLPDVHVAGTSCVGCAVATKRLLYPALVGQDIGCGIATAAFDATASSLLPHAERLLETLLERVPIIRHRGSLAERPTAPLPNVDDLSHPSLASAARRDGLRELGTLGRGNHFIEFQRDADDRLWLMVHSGSRVMGERITAHHGAIALRRRGGLPALDLDHEGGQAYLADVGWACRFARANRQAMVEAVSDAIGARFGLRIDPTSLVDCDHNHVRIETLEGERRLVHRKGASPAHADAVGLIPGAMGRDSFHVSGRGVAASLHSSSHGAGRVMSRGRARHAFDQRTLRRSLADVTVARGIAPRLAEELPEAYRDIHAVMRAQRALVRIERVVRGFVVHKGVD